MNAIIYPHETIFVTRNRPELPDFAYFSVLDWQHFFAYGTDWLLDYHRITQQPNPWFNPCRIPAGYRFLPSKVKKETIFTDMHERSDLPHGINVIHSTQKEDRVVNLPDGLSCWYNIWYVLRRGV